MPSASVTSKGQITIPKAIRDLLRVQTGDRVDFVVDGNTVLLRPGTLELGSLRGLLHRPLQKPVSLQEMDAAISKAHVRVRARARNPKKAR